MTTEEIMSLALGMSGYLRIPEDSSIFVPGKGIRKVLFGLDVGTAELQLAKTMGADLVIAHHPPATAVEVWKIFLRHVEFMSAAGHGQCQRPGAQGRRRPRRLHKWRLSRCPHLFYARRGSGRLHPHRLWRIAAPARRRPRQPDRHRSPGR